MRRRLIALAVVALALLPFTAEAQQTRVVADCASTGLSWAVDNLGRPLTINQNGILCTNATGGGGGGAGTEYTEDAAAPANPVAPALSLRRKDTLSASEVTADGDWITAQANAKGEQYVKDSDVLAAINSPIPAGTNLIGDVNVRQGGTALSITNPIFNRPVATATGGASTTGNIAANNTTAVVVKASAGTLYGAQLGGIGSAPAYLKIYNATSATCGSGTPVKRLIIPAASTAANGAGSNINFGSSGIDFSTGITYCITTGIGDADTTAPAASTYLVNLDWK